MFNIKTILIIVGIVILAFVGYSFMISGKKDVPASGVSKQAVGTSATATQTPVNANLDGPGKEFVTQLLAIQNIKLNLALFADPVFQGLQDWSREILPQEAGRPNPFAPLEDTGSVGQATNIFSGDISSVETTNGGQTDADQPATSAKAPVKTPARTR
ncbi:MAG: hypothetical protein QG568_91 [Patescibacteria group bacterium]|nr:hypothetical protein [Patescibacteria group bacterium]